MSLPPSPGPGRINRLLVVLLGLGLFLLVLGLKLEVIDRAGSDLPNWDQWDAEGLHVYLPWAQHRLGVADIFRAHNEHRIVLTKLLGMAELAINGQWDARLQCVVNALLHAGIALLVFATARRHLAPAWHAPWFALVALLCGLPVAWQNVLGGFHSQQYFLLGLSFGALSLLAFAAPLTPRWWIGAGCAFLALFSMGSGLFAAAIVLIIALLRGWRLNLRPLIPIPTVVLCLAVIGLGLLGRVEVSYHDNLKAHTASDFFLYIVHSLQWPFAHQSWLAALIWLPLVALLVVVIRRRETDPAAIDFPLFILGLGGWVVLQILATAYARGAGADNPASRYVDTLAIGVLANALALAWLVSRRLLPIRPLNLAVAGVWYAAVAAGLYGQARQVYTQDLPEVHRHMTACEEHVRNYLATGDPRFLDDDNVPYPSASAFRERIDLTALQAIMPASVRRPLTLEVFQPGPFQLHDTRTRRRDYSAPAAAKPTGLAPSVEPLVATRTWGSFGAATTSEWNSVSFRLAHRTRLRFRVAGDLGLGGTQLEIRDTQGSALADVGAAARVGPGWRTAEVGLTASDVVVHAELTDRNRWFAFSEPVEVAPLSAWTARLVPQGRKLWQVAAVASALLWLVLAALAWRDRKALPGRGIS